MKAHLVHQAGYCVSVICHRLLRNNSQHCANATMPVRWTLAGGDGSTMSVYTGGEDE